MWESHPPNTGELSPLPDPGPHTERLRVNAQEFNQDVPINFGQERIEQPAREGTRHWLERHEIRQ
jgi:hypothetical protein